jgi:hypothetical protein
MRRAVVVDAGYAARSSQAAHFFETLSILGKLERRSSAMTRNEPVEAAAK